MDWQAVLLLNVGDHCDGNNPSLSLKLLEQSSIAIIIPKLKSRHAKGALDLIISNIDIAKYMPNLWDSSQFECWDTEILGNNKNNRLFTLKSIIPSFQHSMWRDKSNAVKNHMLSGNCRIFEAFT